MRYRLNLKYFTNQDEGNFSFMRIKLYQFEIQKQKSKLAQTKVFHFSKKSLKFNPMNKSTMDSFLWPQENKLDQIYCSFPQSQQQLLKILRMFRNVYIEAYKNALQQNNSLQMMLIHVNYIHSVMGCVIQDIQFMVGNALTQINRTGNEDKQAIKKAVQRQRLGESEKVREAEFKLPKIQHLPSSSFKDDLPVSFKHEPTKPRSNNENNIHRNDSFEEMFPNLQQRKKFENVNPSDLEQKNNFTNSKIPPDSQEDFMDFLFKKKNK